MRNFRSVRSLAVVAGMLLQACAGGESGGGPTAVSDSGSVPAATEVPAAELPPAATPAPIPAPAPAPADLRDERNALRLAAAMINATDQTPVFSAARWSTAPWRIRSRTDLSGCTTTVYMNADGLPSAGDSYETRYVNCKVGVTDGSWTLNSTARSTLDAISNPQTPPLLAWTAAHTTTSASTLNWDVPATVSAYRFKGEGNSTFDGQIGIDHKSDGSRQEVTTVRRSAKGIESLGVFDFIIESRITCDFAPPETVGRCSNAPMRLSGTLAGLPADATMTQTKTNPPEFTIVQGSQTIAVTRNPSNGAYTVTTTGGTVLVTTVLDLIAGY